MNPLAEARARVIEACDGLDDDPTERSWIDPDDVRFLLGAFTREDVKWLRAYAGFRLGDDFLTDAERDHITGLAARIEALLPPEPVHGNQ